MEVKPYLTFNGRCSPRFGMVDDRFGMSWMVVMMPTA
jgi:hypothetical protein